MPLSYWREKTVFEHASIVSEIRHFLRMSPGRKLMDAIYNNCVNEEWEYPFFTINMLYSDSTIKINQEFIAAIENAYSKLYGIGEE